MKTLREQEIRVLRLIRLYQAKNDALTSIVRFADTFSHILLQPLSKKARKNSTDTTTAILSHQEPICGFDSRYLDYLPDSVADLGNDSFPSWKSPFHGQVPVDVQDREGLIDRLTGFICLESRSSCSLHKHTHMPLRSSLDVPTRPHADFKDARIRTKIEYPTPLWAHLQTHINDLEIFDVEQNQLKHVQSRIQQLYDRQLWRYHRTVVLDLKAEQGDEQDWKRACIQFLVPFSEPPSLGHLSASATLNHVS
jgi:hypothetical protein